MNVKKSILGKMIMAIILFIVCITNVRAIASDYDLGFKFYRYDYTTYGNDVGLWLDDFAENHINLDDIVLDNNAQINPGDYIVVGNTIRYTAEDTTAADMTGFSFFYRIDRTLFNVITRPEGEDEYGDPVDELTLLIDNRTTGRGGTFPAKWEGEDVSFVYADGIVAVNLSSSVSKVSKYKNTNDQPLSFVVLQLKEDAPEGASINFSYFSDDLSETMGQNSYDEPLDFNIHNATELTVFGEAPTPSTLTDIQIAYTVSSTGYVAILEPTYISTTREYETTVPSSVSDVTFKLTLSDDATIITSTSGTVRAVTGGYEIDVTGLVASTINDIEFTVLEEVDGETVAKVYTVHITKIDNDTGFTLSLSGIDNDDITYDADTKTYTVSTNIDSTTVTATPTNGEAVVTSGNGTWSLSDGLNTRSIIVKGADCQDKHSSVPGAICTIDTYTVKITKLSTDARLQTLNVTSSDATGAATTGTLTPAFNVNDAVGTTYTYYYSENTTKINVQGVVVDAGKATITSGTGEYILSDSVTSATVTVTAEDGEATRDYVINFARQQSNDSTLKSLTVKNGTTEYALSPGFNASQTSYSVTVPHEIGNVAISAEANSTHVKSVTGTGTVMLDTFEPVVRQIVVTAEDNTYTTYTVTITREKCNNVYLTDLKVNGTTISGFNRETENYNYSDVNGDVNSLTITYTTEEPHSTVAVTGDTLHDGNNAIKVTVTAQDNSTKVYTINVRRLSSNAKLQSLTVTSDPSGTLTPGFSDTHYTYTYTYDRTVSTIDIAATAVSGLPVTGVGSYNVATDTSATLTSTSEDGKGQVYTISFVQDQETDSTLESLVVSSGETNYDATITGNTYRVTVPGNVGVVDITATPNGNYTQTGVITRTVNLTATTTTETIEVVAENGSKTQYTVEITRQLNNEAFLTDLTIDGTPVAGFASGTFEYTVVVSNSTTHINVGESHSLGATVTGSGPKTLDGGTTVILLNVDAENGVGHNTYTLNVRRKSTDASITHLAATSSPISVVNKTGDLTYTVDVPYEADTVTLVPTVATGATVTNPEDLVDINAKTTNQVRIIVRAEDGNTSTYTVTFNVLPSSNAFLDSLSITPGSLNEPFNRDDTSYTATVGTTVDKITISATADDPDTSTVEGTGEKNLDYGENTFIVKVTAGDGTEKSYSIVVTRTKKDIKTLRELTIDGTPIEGFEPSETNYTITVPYNTTTINVNAVPTDAPDATVSGIGAKNITTSPTVIRFTVTAQDNSTQDYTIVVTKAQNNETRPMSLTVFGNTPTWNETDGVYEITVDGDDVLEINPSDVVITPPEGGAVTSKDPRMELSAGDNEYKFTVEAEDGTDEEYTIKINRTPSTVKTLATLTSDVGELSPEFESGEKSYTLTLPAGTTEFTITATATSPRATVTGATNYTIPVTDNRVLVSVVSESNDTEIYTIRLEFEDDPNPTRIISSVHTLDNDYVLTARPGTDLATFISEFDNDPAELFVYEKDGTTRVTNKTIGTGMIIKLERGDQVLDQLAVVIVGDTNGDGAITINDAAMIVNHALGYPLSGAYFVAGDVNKDGADTINDAAMIVNHTLGNSIY